MTEIDQRLAGLSPAKRALLEKRLAARAPASAPVAVVGMACRLPGAPSIDEYWRVIRDGVDATREVPPDRWDVDAFYDPTGERPGSTRTRRGAFLDGIDQFDPQLFGVTPREANRMDPQQRLLLEAAWDAMEHAGRPADQLAGSRTGVFIGIGGADYAKTPLHNAQDYFAAIDGYMGTGNALSIAANRLSYVFDLHGPSMAIDTACSSSSVALHLAVQSLRRGECDAALAGGVNAILTPETTIAFSNAQMLSPGGRCRPFDAAADGYVRGEGCGVVLLKRLADAERDGDHVLAVIRGTAINQDGRTSGISAPSGELQKACIRAALADAGLKPDDVSYIEAHGTGTPLGDPIEMGALVDVFKSHGADAPPLLVTSVKANIGHTETVSGVAGLIKTILLMQHGVVTQQWLLQTLNPHIKLDGARVVVPTDTHEWKGRRVAGVSSFGFGGANAHIVVEAPAPAGPDGQAPPERPLHALKLSAKTPGALAARARAYADYLAASPETNVADFCFSANTAQSDFPHRAVITARDQAELIARLHGAAADEDAAPGVWRRSAALKRAKAALLFSGQGSQYPGMGRQLYETHPVFREAVDRCDAALLGVLDTPIKRVLWPGEGDNAELVHQTAYTQPALFTIDYALAELWRALGVTPALVAGHSIGEYVAATVAGAIDLDDALRLVAERGRLMQSAPAGGRMVAVLAPWREVRDAIGDDEPVALAAVNAPETAVLSGEAEAVNRVAAALAEHGYATRPLRVSHAFHSPMMEGVLNEFERFAEQFEYRRPQIPLASNLTGELMTDAPTAHYWRDHLRGTVRWLDCLERIAERGATHVVEAGPGSALLGLARRTLTDAYSAPVAFLPSVREGHEDHEVLTASIAQLYTTGGRVDWRGWDRGRTRRRVTLPGYPFERVRCWLETSTDGQRHAPLSAPSEFPTLGARVPTVWSTRVFESLVGGSSGAYLRDHVVQGSATAPAAYFIEQALEAAQACLGEGPHAVEDVRIGRAMFLPDSGALPVQATVAPESAGACGFECYSRGQESDAWTLHATARLRRDEAPATGAPAPELSAEATSVSAREFYNRAAQSGFAYGPRFQAVESLETEPWRAVARLKPNAVAPHDAARCRLHPVLGDACLQTLAAAIGAACDDAYLPVGVARVAVHKPLTGAVLSRLRCYAVVEGDAQDRASDTLVGDAWLIDSRGETVAELRGIRVQRVATSSGDHPGRTQNRRYEVRWREAPAAAAQGALPTGPWLLFADKGGFAHALAERLVASGASAMLVSRADAFAMEVERGQPLTRIQIDPSDESHYRRLLEVVCANPASPLAGVVHAWSLDAQEVSDANETLASAVFATRQLARRRLRPSPRLWLVSAGAVAVGEGDLLSVAQAPIIGLGRVVQLEHPELSPALVDLDPQTDAPAQVDRVYQEFAARHGDQSSETQVALRGETRLVPRLAPVAPDDSATDAIDVPQGGPHQLRIPTPGAFDALRYQPITRRAPGRGEVELEVHAAGLNFSDVLKALGLYPGVEDEVTPLGIEASGVVTAVGDGVDDFQPGDEVFGVAPYAFASHATTGAYALAKKPASMTHAQAAGVPIAFLTACHALVRLARLGRGERVLIHAGAGGVGLAAIQIAQHIGAEVFATAGSEEKRDYLRSLGVRHVMNSRTLDFADEIIEVTRGDGVDVVLNSLPGEAIAASLAALGAYGRLLEIGKIDIYQDHKLGLAPFRDNLSYFAIDLDRVLRQRPDYVREMLAELIARFEAGDYRPVNLTSFDARGTIAAFRYMSQRKNIGKVVVEYAPGQAAKETAEDALVRADGAYLITGGRGAIGLRLAEWLADCGAGAVVLLSRGAPGVEAAEQTEELRLRTRVEVLSADVTDFDELCEALAALPRDLPPLRGVLHAAGVLRDGLLAEMTPGQLDAAVAPKLRGAWNLHEATLAAPLDFFVLFSSLASVLGSPGQANYAAGNAALDALAHERRRQGLPATSINWGPWAESGMASEEGRVASLERRGLRLLPPEDCLRELETAIREGAPQRVFVDARWPDVAAAFGSRRLPILAELVDESASSSQAAGEKDRLRGELAALDPQPRRERLLEIVRRDLAKVMTVQPEHIDTGQPLSEFGIDSLMSLELKNSLESRLAVTLPMAKLLEGPSVESLADLVSELITDAAATPGADAWTPLTALRRGEGPPLFLMPALGGDIRCYHELVKRLSPDAPVFAFRPRGLDDTGPVHESMDEMADDYAQAILDEYDEGPVLLAGWSTGGVPAVAVAERLERAGRQVGAVALFDTPLPAIYKSVDLDDEVGLLADVLDFANRFSGAQAPIRTESLAHLPDAERFSAAVAHAKEHGLVPQEADEAYLHRVVAAGLGFIRAAAGYEPAPIAAPVHLFRPETHGALRQIAASEPLPDHGWRAATGQEIVLHTVPGDHFSMMVGEGAGRLAEEVAKLKGGVESR